MRGADITPESPPSPLLLPSPPLLSLLLSLSVLDGNGDDDVDGEEDDVADDVARSVRDRKLGCEHAAFVAHKQVAQC
jgi:hypothetical protein